MSGPSPGFGAGVIHRRWMVRLVVEEEDGDAEGAVLQLRREAVSLRWMRRDNMAVVDVV